MKKTLIVAGLITAAGLVAAAPAVADPESTVSCSPMPLCQINAGRAARTPNGINLLVELAEALQAPVNGGGDRVNFPSRHALAGDALGQPDVILDLEVQGGPRSAASAATKRISITAADLFIKSNLQDFQHMPEVDLAVAADAEATLPALIEEVKRQLTADRRRGTGHPRRGGREGEGEGQDERGTTHATSGGARW